MEEEEEEEEDPVPRMITSYSGTRLVHQWALRPKPVVQAAWPVLVQLYLYPIKRFTCRALVKLLARAFHYTVVELYLGAVLYRYRVCPLV